MDEKPDRLDRLYNLLPAVYRLRDADQGYPLRALLRVIAEQVNVVEDDIARLYDDWFIETAQDWVVPYIGDLVGYHPAHQAGEPTDVSAAEGRALNKILIPRRDVAKTIGYRRRKGTLALLETLANDVAGWPARAVEFFRLLDWTQNINHQQLERGRTVDLRQGDALDLLGGPFDALAHTVDVRKDQLAPLARPPQHSQRRVVRLAAEGISGRSHAGFLSRRGRPTLLHLQFARQRCAPLRQARSGI